MNYINLKPTGKQMTVKTKFDGLKKLPEYVGKRGGKYYFDFCYFGSCNFDVYKIRANNDVCIARHVQVDI